MMGTVILGIVVVWLLLAVGVSVAVAAIARAGLQEDRSRGYLVDHR
jgi:hypothetical protein